MRFGILFALLLIPLINGRYLLVDVGRYQSDIKNGSDSSRCFCTCCGCDPCLKNTRIPETVVEKEPETKMCAEPPCPEWPPKSIEDGFINKPKPHPKSCVPLNGRCSLDKPNLTSLTMKLEFSFRSARKSGFGSCCEPNICFPFRLYPICVPPKRG